MPLSGLQLIGATAVRGAGAAFHALDAASGAPLEPAYFSAADADIAAACALAAAASDRFKAAPPLDRARLLEVIADNILALGDRLIERAMLETGLPRGRLEGERRRTIGQLNLFAEVVRDGGYLDVRLDAALPDRTPAPRPDLRLCHIPIGPVVVFGASNFPLAFSVAGGDTASALAAGCPVIVKAHPAHPGVSELVGRAVRDAVSTLGLPEGVFSLLFDEGREVGPALVADPRVRAVGFTGSRQGGEALMRIAAARRDPIPVFAEMSSINPVFLLPDALRTRSRQIADGFIASLTLGAGQFCTNPGLVLGLDGPDLDVFLEQAATALASAPAQTMLTPGIHKAYCAGLAALGAHPAVDQVGAGAPGAGMAGRSALFTTTGAAFLDHPPLAEEIFGAAGLVVRCRDVAELHAVADGLEGQLTAAIHASAQDASEARALVPLLERKVGRILFNGFGTGVEVSAAMVHGGPYPATSDGRSTSVGTLAIQRFIRPVCYQDFPADLLPPALADDNPYTLPRRLNGVLTR